MRLQGASGFNPSTGYGPFLLLAAECLLCAQPLLILCGEHRTGSTPGTYLLTVGSSVIPS